MKILTKIFLTVLMFTSISMYAQSESKATVYIVRPSGLGSMIKFQYFVDDQYFGQCSSGKYLIIEVDPGKHIIWAKSENYSFVDAELQAGKSYYLIAKVRMGFGKAAVKLEVVLPNDLSSLQKVQRSLKNHKLYTFEGYKNDKRKAKVEKAIKKSKEKYKKETDIPVLNQNVII